MLLKACQIFVLFLTLFGKLAHREKASATSVIASRKSHSTESDRIVTLQKNNVLSDTIKDQSGTSKNNSKTERRQGECKAPVIILKADDFIDMTLNWQKFINIIKDNNICASLGVYPGAIHSSASVNSLKAIASLTQTLDTSQPVFELWSHGYNHKEYNAEKLYYDSLQPAFADYDGDGKTDVSVKTHQGRWLIDFSRNDEGFHVWHEIPGFYGDATAHPVPADYDGDKRADMSVKTDNGDWLIDLAANGFGCWDECILKCSDAYARPVPADYDGDDKADLSVLTATGHWLIDYAANGFGCWDADYYHYGSSKIKPVPADYDGDGKADLAVYLPNGSWLVDLSSTGFGTWDRAAGSQAFKPYANSSNVAVASDYDGDHKADLSIVNGKGDWFIDKSGNGFGTIDQQTKRLITYSHFTPVPGDFDGVGHAQESMVASTVTNEFTWVVDRAGTGIFQTGIRQVVEFSGTPKIFQESHIQFAQQYFQDTLRRRNHTFGAPFNGSDAHTNASISNFNDINVWLLYLPILQNGRNVGGNDVYPDHHWKNAKLGLGAKDNHMFLNIDRTYYNSYDKFSAQPIIDNYPTDSSAPYIMLQIHPNAWHDPSFFQDLDRLIKFYKSNDAVFMTPYQYFRYLRGNGSGGCERASP
jgi:hypothetical protein